jgi:hypothetical protein
MNFTVLTPNDSPLMYNKSDATHSNFGGQRQKLHIPVGDDNDYTVRKGDDPNTDQNPIDTSIRDIDEMSNLEERKNRFTQEEIKSNCQEGNDSLGIQSDPENRPRMDEGTDGIQVPSSVFRKQLKKTNKWQFAKSEHYESEMS